MKIKTFIMASSFSSSNKHRLFKFDHNHLFDNGIFDPESLVYKKHKDRYMQYVDYVILYDNGKFDIQFTTAITDFDCDNVIRILRIVDKDIEEIGMKTKFKRNTSNEHVVSIHGTYFYPFKTVSYYDKNKNQCCIL